MPRITSTKFFVVLFLFASPSALATPDRSFQSDLEASVFNDAHVPSLVLEQAEARASWILGQAGIHVQWLNCSATRRPAPDEFHAPTPCSSITFPDHLSVRIVSGFRAAGEDTFGQSFLDDSGVGAYCNVYYDRIAAFPLGGLLSAGEVLGHVIAHEIGHLLLGPHSHSLSGIMSARWSPDHLRLAARGSLAFTPAQAAALRSRLASPSARPSPSSPHPSGYFLVLRRESHACSSAYPVPFPSIVMR